MNDEDYIGTTPVPYGTGTATYRAGEEYIPLDFEPGGEFG